MAAASKIKTTMTKKEKKRKKKVYLKCVFCQLSEEGTGFLTALVFTLRSSQANQESVPLHLELQHRDAGCSPVA